MCKAASLLPKADLLVRTAPISDEILASLEDVLNEPGFRAAAAETAARQAGGPSCARPPAPYTAPAGDAKRSLGFAAGP